MVTPPMQIAIAIICFMLLIKGVVKAFRIIREHQYFNDDENKPKELTEVQKQAIHYRSKYGPVASSYRIMADILHEKRYHGESTEYHFLLQVQQEIKYPTY